MMEDMAQLTSLLKAALNVRMLCFPMFDQMSRDKQIAVRDSVSIRLV